LVNFQYSSTVSLPLAAPHFDIKLGGEFYIHHLTQTQQAFEVDVLLALFELPNPAA
jgi:hypothetical protein